MDLAFAREYFDAERAESVLFIAVGMAALGLAAWLLWQRPGALARGAAWPLVLVAVIQLGVGTGIYLRTPADVARVEAQLRDAPLRLANEEIPRMQQVMRAFVAYRYVEIALLLLGVALAAWAAPGGWWRGVGLGLVPQAGLMLALDLCAEARGASYLVALRTLATP